MKSGLRRNYMRADAAFCSWRDDVITGKAPTLYPVGIRQFQCVEIGPSLVTLIGGAPGAGKTTLSMQFTCDALRLTKDLRALVCNVEMPPHVLLDRQLARLAGIPGELIRHRKLGAEHGSRLARGLKELEDFVDRLAFLQAPFTLENVAASADDFDAGLLVLDYVQRISPKEKHLDGRGAVNALVNDLRQFADAGVAILLVAAVGRTKDQKGRTSYAAEGLNLASFRESSELEFGADTAWLLAPDERHPNRVKLRCLKNRYGETNDISLVFDRPRQRFYEPGGMATVPEANKVVQSELAERWKKGPSGNDDHGFVAGGNDG